MASAPASFDDFVVANGESLLRTARLIVLDDGDAEDVVQECLLTLARRWRQVSMMDQPRAYARQVLVNVAVRGSTKRTRRRSELGVQPVESGSVSGAVELLGVREELLASMRQLTARQRTVLVL